MTDLESVDQAEPQPGGNGPGPVMVIGGAEDKLKERLILSRFLELAGGAEARIVVISTASSLGDVATDLYRELFEHIGCAHVKGLRPLSREEANDPAAEAAVREATGIFLSGGNQLRLASVVGGTKLGAALLEAHERGVVVAGTSAGASAVSTHMVAFGASGATPKHRMAQISAGLGLLKGVVVDQHFEQRTRLGRLLSVVSQSPSLVGLGLDEDTAAIIHADQTIEVIGKGAVTIVDGSQVTTDSFHTKGHRPMMVSGVILHSLPAGYWFDLQSRALIPVVTEVGARQEQVIESGRRRLQRLSRQLAAEGANTFVVERRRRRRRKNQSEREASE